MLLTPRKQCKAQKNGDSFNVGPHNCDAQIHAHARIHCVMTYGMDHHRQGNLWGPADSD